MSPEPGSAAGVVIDMPAREAAAHYPDIVGFIDSFNGTRLAGWAWDRQTPGTPLEVELRLDDQPFATALADRPRADLAAAGTMGEGAYGFEVMVPEVLGKEDLHRLSAYVHHGGRCGAIRLKNQVALNTGEDGGTAAEYALIVDQLDQCLADQRAGFRWVYNELQSLATMLKEDQVGLAAEIESEIADTLEDLSIAHETLARRFDGLEVYHARVDEVLAALKKEKGRAAPGGADQRGLKRLVGLLACLTAVSLALGIASLG